MARFAVATINDHSANVWIVTILSLIYTTMTLMVRAVIKRGSLGTEDIAIFVAQLFAYGEYAAIFVGLSTGFGKNLEMLRETQQLGGAKAFIASQVPYVLCLALSKVTVGLLLRRIFHRLAYKHASMLCNVFLGTVAFWGIASAITVSVRCDANHILPEHDTTQCTGNVTRWLAVTAFDCVTELSIVILSVYLVADLQMKVGDKVMTSAAFACRLGLVPISVLQYRAYDTVMNQDGEGVSFSILLIIRQSAICYSLLSATWPFSRNLIKGFNTGGLMISYGDTVDRSGTRSGALRSGQDKQSSNAIRSMTSSGNQRMRNDRVVYCTSAHYESDAPGEDRRFGSSEMIIRRDDTYTVIHDT